MIAVYLVVLLALQLPRLSRRFARSSNASDSYSRSNGWAMSESPGGAANGTRDPTADERAGIDGASLLTTGSGGLPSGLYQRMTRVVSFVFIGSALVLAVVTTSPQQAIVILWLAFGLIMIELFQDVLPAAALGRWRLPVEATVVLLFLTALIVMTGGQNSPYFFGYILLVGAAGLSTSELGGVSLAIVSSVAYLVAVILASGLQPLPAEDMGIVAFNLISIALVMFVASVIGREQRRAHEEALRLSRFDSLTTLHSRDYFTSELEQEILRATRTGRPFALAMLDLDGLKAANDRFGHDWGDNLLRAVADVLRGDVRVTDVAARYGGDEFVLMLPETDLSGAILVAEKVRVDISRVALPHDGQVVRTSASIGIVTFPHDGRTSAELLRRADLAMYEAKRRGRDQIVRFARDGATPAPVVGPRSTVASTGLEQPPRSSVPIQSVAQIPAPPAPTELPAPLVETPRPMNQPAPTTIVEQPQPDLEPAAVAIAVRPEPLRASATVVPRNASLSRPFRLRLRASRHGTCRNYVDERAPRASQGVHVASGRERHRPAQGRRVRHQGTGRCDPNSERRAASRRRPDLPGGDVQRDLGGGAG